MPYKDEINVVAHDFTTTTVTIDGDHNVNGMEMLEVDREEDRVSMQAVADGFGWFVKNASRLGMIKIQVADASPTTSYLWDKYNADDSFSFASSDSNAPAYKVNNSIMRIAKQPTIKRGKEGDVVEWVLITPYLNARGGSYRLETI